MITDEQVYDALLAFRVEQTDKTKDAAGRYLAVLAIHGEPTPDDPLWQPMRVALRVALREAEADLDHERARVERYISAFRGLSSQYVAMQAERDTLARQIEAVRALHVRDDDTDACYGCYSTWPGYAEEHPKWPCATLRALDGEA